MKLQLKGSKVTFLRRIKWFLETQGNVLQNYNLEVKDLIYLLSIKDS